ncbi:MAG: class I SAM-dependent methyltransferase [Draconibacterium sp.]|nr:class I SAM-dependent methyltransferase [Draconibacterium sp.]
MKQLVDFFQDKKVKKVLDVGTGSGNFLAVLKSACPDADITGIDPNSESLKEAAEKFPEVRLKKMSAENIELPENYFDVTSISMALHHLSDVEGALKEMKRVTKPNGWIIVSELFSDNLNRAQEVHKMYHHFGSRIDRILGVSHNKSFKKNDILKTVEDCGIDILFHFEYNKVVNTVLTPEELAARVKKMKERIETINHFSEYEMLKSQIEQFRINAEKYGFQSATRVVIVGKN